MAESNGDVPRVQLVKGQEVSLGCGTLMIIALIVFFFAGRRNNDGLESEVRGLRNEIAELRVTIESLETAIERDRQSTTVEDEGGA